MDEHSATQSLKAQLSQKESELELQKLHSANERSELGNFICKLMQACRGVDRELDNRMARLKTLFDKQADVEEMNLEIKNIEAQLTRYSQIENQMLLSLREQTKSQAQDISKNVLLPGKIRRQAKELLSVETPYTIGEHQQLIFRLLDIYQIALKNLIDIANGPEINAEPREISKLIKDKKTFIHINEHDRLVSLSHLDPSVLTQIHDELQRMITELDFNGPAGEKLAAIRRRLLVGVDWQDLPALCLEIVTLIIEGARYERSQSFAFVSLMGDKLQLTQDDLATVQLNVHTLAEADKQQNKLLVEAINAAKGSLKNSQTLQEIQTQMPQHIALMEHAVTARQAHEQTELELLTRLKQLNERLLQAEQEAEEYKNRLNRQQQRLQVDTLTQLNNRSALDERLALEYKRWLRYQSPLCLAIVDVDHFKRINDTYGHLAGDKALKVIARAISTALRESDFVARFGGEEFVVLLPGINANTMELPLEKIRNVVKSIPFRFKDERLSISISVGATLFRTGDRITDAFERADRALYEAKNAGRDRIIINN